MSVNILGIDFESIADGDGVRVVIFFSGCKHNCKGCHNPISHDFDAGTPFTTDMQDNIINYINNTPFISGVTLSGGDPMFLAEKITPFIKRLKAETREINIWVYSGFTFEEILKNKNMTALLRECDILVDGRFDIDQRDLTIPYRGSRNQRIINLKEVII